MFLFFHHRTRENGVERGNHFDDHLTAQQDYPCIRRSCQIGILLEVSSDGEPTLRQNSSFTICTIRKLLPDVQRAPPMLICYTQSEPTEKNVPLFLLATFYVCLTTISMHVMYLLLVQDYHAALGWRKSFPFPLALQHINHKLVLTLSQRMNFSFPCCLFVFPEPCLH